MPLRRCKTPRCRNFGIKGPKCHKCYQRAWRANRPMQAAYATLRDHAGAREIEFSITFEYFERFARECNYLERTGLFAACLTVDRIDNTKGYVFGNLQALTRSRNSEKRCKQDAARIVRGNAWRAVAA